MHVPCVRLIEIHPAVLVEWGKMAGKKSTGEVNSTCFS